MFKIILTVILVTIKAILCESEHEPLGCKDVESKLPTLRLKRHLFCDYDASVKPTANTITVGIQFIPKFIDFTEYSNSLDFHTWVILTWNDPHLIWNPDEFEKVDSYHLKTDDIWVPDFCVFNSGGFNMDQTSLPSSDCVLINNGTVQCAVAQTYTTHCPADFVNWPYDEHNCTLHFGSWMHFKNEVVFDFGTEGIMMHEFIKNHNWDIDIHDLTDSLVIYSANDQDTMIFLEVSLRRHAGQASIIFISPMIILATLTLTVLYLDACSLERIAVACSNFVCHLICLFDLHWYMPQNGAISTPKILIFYEASIGLAAFTLIFTSIVRKIHSIKVSAPRFIASTTALILNFPASHYLGLKVVKRQIILDDVDNTEKRSSEIDQVWVECACILEWLAIVVFFLTYIILLGIFLPTSPLAIDGYIY